MTKPTDGAYGNIRTPSTLDERALAASEILFKKNNLDQTLQNGLTKLNEYILGRNTLTLAQFDKYIPLYSHQMIELRNISQEQLNNLGAEWAGRISMFHPIIIIDSNGKNTLDENDNPKDYARKDRQYHQILLIIPPTFTPLKTLNELEYPVDKFIGSLCNALRQNNIFRNDVSKNIHVLRVLSTQLSDEATIKQYAKIYQDYETMIEKTNTDTTSAEGKQNVDVDAWFN